MSDLFGKTYGEDGKTRPGCRVAYTLNNTQPVSCTIIDDQPLFYMDFDSAYDEEEAFFDATEMDMGVLENELRMLEQEIAAYDKFSMGSSVSTEQRVNEFLDSIDSITTPAPKQTKENLLDELTDILAQSRIVKAHLDFAREHNVKILLSTQIEDGFYDRRAGLILINPNIDMPEQILLCARELRRHWQHRQGALIHPLTFQPDNAVLVNRAQIADLSVFMVRAAWELQLSGNKQAWDRIEASSMADIGRAFAREAFLDFRTINNGLASAAAFESWFLSERCRAQDKVLIQQMLADYQGYVFDTDMEMQGITPNLISALGSMPYGKNYLSAHVNIIMNDPIFTDVRDRSNANFLWFIKFERSFKETEQELQTGSAPTGHEFFHDANPHQEQDRNHEQQQSAEIVTLFEGKPEKTTKPDKGSARKGPLGKGKSADIIYLRRIPGDLY